MKISELKIKTKHKKLMYVNFKSYLTFISNLAS